MPVLGLVACDVEAHDVNRNATLAQVASHPSAALGGGGGENGDLADLQHELESTLALEISRQEISMRREPDGLVISLLLRHNCRLRIEGHTDNVPIHTPRFSSNWEPSRTWATEIIRLLIGRNGFDPRNLGAAGTGQYHPVASNDTKEGRNMNRRGDIVIRGGTAAVAPAAFGPPRHPATPGPGPVPRPSQ